MTILSEEVLSLPPSNFNFWVCCVLFFGMVFLVLIIACIGLKAKKSFCAAIIVFIIVVLFLNKTRPQYQNYKQYKVLIDDNVSFHEIMDNYDLIRVEGLIYTIREKTPENGD